MADARLRHLQHVTDQCTAMKTRTDELGRYLGDISRIYYHLNHMTSDVTSQLSLTCIVHHRYLDVRIAGLEPCNQMTRFIKVDISPYLPSLFHHVCDSHVISESRSRDKSRDIVVTMELPAVAMVTLIKVDVSLVYQCPSSIQQKIHADKQFFCLPIHSETVAPHATSRADHVVTREVPNFLLSFERSLNNDRTSYCLRVRSKEKLPGDLPGEIETDIMGDSSRNAQELLSEYRISKLSRDELLGVIVRLKKYGVQMDNECERAISSTSSLEKLLDAYHSIRGITIL